MEITVLTAYIPLLLTEQVEERSRLTCEALADFDDTRVLDHQSGQAWLTVLTTRSRSRFRVD